jgi:subtilisin family serine protease
MKFRAVLVAALPLLFATPAHGQTPQVRLAAPADCPRNINCIPGLRRVYHLDPSPLFVPLKVADAGVERLDDGTAQVAAVFSSHPQLSRPDITALHDDKAMITGDHIVPVVRAGVLERYGAPLRRRLNAASRLLSTLQLRGLNEEVIDGRLPEAVGGEFADANGLGGPSRTRRGPMIDVGYQAFDENQTVAYFYAEALRGAGFRVRVREAGGLRPQTVAALRAGRIDLWPGYSGSLLGYLGGRSLTRALARIHARPLRLSPAQNRNEFVVKRDVAGALGITKLSDLGRYWPAAGAATTAAAMQGSAAADAGDSLQGEQWAIAQGSLLDLPGAWKLSQGEGVTVAIVDSGARLEHPDLAPNIWTDFDEVPGNGTDDDANGYVDDVHGVDLTSTDPQEDLSDGNGHGTHVAGIVAAAGNGAGVVGVAPRAKLMIVKVLKADGSGSTGSLAEGIRYAAANGARVINVSLAGSDNDPRVVEAVQAAADANALVIASAGNDGRDIDTQPAYPAAIPASNLLAVASTDPDNGRGISNYSNFGRLAVQVAAPGARILSTANDGGFAEKSGTSMAAPMVAGVAALAIAAHPQISAVDLRALLMQNAARSQLPVAAGYVDALHTVQAASSTAGTNVSQPPRLQILTATTKGRKTRIQAAITGSTAAIAAYRVTLGKRTVAQLPANRSPFTVDVRHRGARVRVDALDADGRPVVSAKRSVKKVRKGKRDVGTGGRIGA